MEITTAGGSSFSCSSSLAAETADADAAIAVSSGAAIAREIADITITEENLEKLLVLREIAEQLQKRIRFNYRMIITVNSGLILLGVFGILQPSATAYLHNFSTLALSLHSMTDLPLNASSAK